MIRPPLWAVRSLKVKFSIVIVSAVALTAVVSHIGWRLAWPLWQRPLVAAVLALGIVLWLARGMTQPLRDMEAVARAMAAGDHSQRVHTDSCDEVGRLAGAFNSMAADLAELDRERRAFVANAAHELRTPLAGLQASIENVLDGVTPFDHATAAQLHHQTHRLARLVHDLLDLSRLEDPTMRLRVEPLDVGTVVHDAVEVAAARHPCVEFTIGTVDVATVEADPDLVARVLVNLLDNAVAYGRAPVTVASRTDSQTVSISIHDRGSGFGDEASHLFEPFRRGDRSATTTGSGLGLAICRSIVELHHGTITASSGPQGCTLTVGLPIRQPA